LRLPDSPPTLSKRQKQFLKRQLTKSGFKSYRSYLRSDHWKELTDRYRASKLSQVCLVCWDPNVDLHHKTYKRVGEEKLTDLIPLCRFHHDLAHKLEQEWRCAGVEASKLNLWAVASYLREHRYEDTVNPLPRWGQQAKSSQTRFKASLWPRRVGGQCNRTPRPSSIGKKEGRTASLIDPGAILKPFAASDM
jgi:hypothetical protein